MNFHRKLKKTEIDRRAVVCREIILKAGAVARQGFEVCRRGKTRMKGPQDFLTETDIAVENLIRNEIEARFPKDGFLGEETGGAISNVYWVVDPIDGTANFARGIPHYCVVIAFVCFGDVEFGAIYDPTHEELFFARRGEGAYQNGRVISVSGTQRYDEATIETGWSNRRSNAEYINVVARLLEAGTNVRRAASGALALAYVASGRTDAYAELHMNAWDCLAGLLLVREAGGVVGGLIRGEALHEGGAVLAATPAVASLVSRVTGIATA